MALVLEVSCQCFKFIRDLVSVYKLNCDVSFGAFDIWSTLQSVLMAFGSIVIVSVLWSYVWMIGLLFVKFTKCSKFFF